MKRAWNESSSWYHSFKSWSISIKEYYLILFYHLKKSLYYLYHLILQYFPHPKTLFLLKYYSLIFLYYFFLTDSFFQFHFHRLSNSFFFSSASLSSIFLGFPIVFFFLSLPQPLAPVHHTQPHTQTHQQSPTHTHTQTIKPEPTTATT